MVRDLVEEVTELLWAELSILFKKVAEETLLDEEFHCIDTAIGGAPAQIEDGLSIMSHSLDSCSPGTPLHEVFVEPQIDLVGVYYVDELPRHPLLFGLRLLILPVSISLSGPPEARDAPSKSVKENSGNNSQWFWGWTPSRSTHSVRPSFSRLALSHCWPSITSF